MVSSLTVRVLGLAALISLLASACASRTRAQQEMCAERDWYELGRRDGSQGATLDRLISYRKDCGARLTSELETLYMNARNAGLVEYCMPENAFELGRMGLSYSYVCPSTMEPSFLMAYRKGQQARLLQLKKKDLDAKIDSLTQDLLNAQAGSAESRQLSIKLEHLKKLRANNTKEMDQIRWR